MIPHIKNHLVANVPIGPFTDTVHLPTTELDWTGEPEFTLGYRLPQGAGEFLFRYRFLVTEGTGVLPGYDLDGSDVPIRSRLNLNVLDFDYASHEFSLAPYWDMKWHVGVRLADVFFDSLANGFFIEQRTANMFLGAGPHAGLDLWRSLGTQNLGLYFGMDVASLLGRIHQAFEEIVVADDGEILGGATDVRTTQVIPVLNVKAGLSWTPCWRGRWSRYSFGYELEQWWYLGQAADSRAELTTQGLFFRAEFGF
jgi:hypothetical protein